MSILRMGLLGLTVLTAVACVAVPPTPSENRKDGEPATLWEADSSILFPALKQFVNAPGTKADRQFVSVEKQQDGTCLFTKVPTGWFTWKDGKSEGRVIVFDKDGFRILIRLEQVDDVEKALLGHIQYGQGRGSIVLIDQLFSSGGNRVTRVVKCAKQKGDTNFVEYRYFEANKTATCVELTVFDWPKEKRTLEHLVTHLRSHYGKYEGVCTLVEAEVWAKR